MVHDTAVGIDAIDVTPVRLAGLTRPALQTPDAPSRRPHGRGAGTLGDQQALGDAWARRSPSFSRCARTASKAEASSAGSSDAAAAG
jgi:hypothetical protein